MDSSSSQKLMAASVSISASFTAKSELVFVLTQQNAFILKATETAWPHLKGGNIDF